MVESAIDWLRQRLPPNWQVTQSRRVPAIGDSTAPREGDAVIEVQGGQGVSTMVVEVKRKLLPRDAAMLLSGLARSLRTVAGDVPILVLAPWLSPRTRELLAADGINFLDRTGNALIRLRHPALFLQASGSDRNPEPESRGPARLRGAKAGRLIRLLADVRPPYGVGAVAAATELNPGYVSRLLDALDGEALIERDRRGAVQSVEVRELLRRWTESFDVFQSNDATTYLAAEGATAAFERLADLRDVSSVAVTGSFAAVRKAPVAAPALLTAYCEDVDRVAGELKLLPADSGANVVLLRPFDPVVWARTERAAGIRYAAVSQVAADCLTGNGRMPAEGDALLGWMGEHEERWRIGGLAEASAAGERA